ncbi:MAG: hypothetical protein J7K82_03720 [Thermoproteales archaeon]|nr:hypothetical protein [Thermoproteales archaeon]
MAKCDFCGKEVYLPYRCKYCGGTFCVEHHLPENHNCPRLKRGEWTPAYLPNRYSTEYKFITKPEIKRARRTQIWTGFSKDEIRDLLLALGAISAVYLSFAFKVFSLSAIFYTLIAVLVAFFVHEMAHRFTAIYYGYKARFVASMEGLILTLISVILPIKILAPGYVAIYGRPGGKLSEMGLIALAGPLSNLALACIALVTPLHALLKYFVILVNADIALFNLLPFAILDGYKIFKWNKIIWLLIFLTAVGLWIYVRF